MTPVWGLKECVVPFVAERLGAPDGFGNCQAMAVLDGNQRFAAGLVFHNWHPEHGVMEVSAAAVDPRWAQRGVLKEAFRYIFETSGCQAAVARTDPGNKAVRRLWAALGAKEYEIPRLRGRGTSEIVLVVTQEAWGACKFAR